MFYLHSHPCPSFVLPTTAPEGAVSRYHANVLTAPFASSLWDFPAFSEQNRKWKLHSPLLWWCHVTNQANPITWSASPVTEPGSSPPNSHPPQNQDTHNNSHPRGQGELLNDDLLLGNWDAAYNYSYYSLAEVFHFTGRPRGTTPGKHTFNTTMSMSTPSPWR